MSNNVVIFPKGKKDAPPQSMQELMDSVEEARRGHIDHIVDEIMSMIMHYTHMEGFDLAQEEKIESAIFLEETLKSTLLDAVDLHHPLQEIVYDVISREDLDDEVNENDPS